MREELLFVTAETDIFTVKITPPTNLIFLKIKLKDDNKSCTTNRREEAQGRKDAQPSVISLFLAVTSRQMKDIYAHACLVSAYCGLVVEVTIHASDHIS